MNPMSVFWCGVSRWITNCFSTTNTTCLHREGCLPPLPVLVCHQRCLAGLRLICSPPEINPATARVPKSVRLFSPHRAPLIGCGKITSQPYLFFNLDCGSAADKVRNPRYQHNAIIALANSALPLTHDVVSLLPISLHLPDYLPPIPGLSHRMRASSSEPSNSSSLTGQPPRPPRTTPIRLQRAPIPLWALANSVREGSTRCAQGKVTSWHTPHGTILTRTRAVRCAPMLRKPSRMPFYRATRPPVRDPASSKGVSDLAPEAPHWSDQQLLIALAEFIHTTGTGSPPRMPPLAPSLHTPRPNPLFPSSTPSAPCPRE